MTGRTLEGRREPSGEKAKGIQIFPWVMLLLLKSLDVLGNEYDKEEWEGGEIGEGGKGEVGRKRRKGRRMEGLRVSTISQYINRSDCKKCSKRRPLGEGERSRIPTGHGRKRPPHRLLPSFPGPRGFLRA